MMILMRCDSYEEVLGVVSHHHHVSDQPRSINGQRDKRVCVCVCVCVCVAVSSPQKNLNRICVKGYLPTNMDILRTRVRTSGIIEQQYRVESARLL